MRKRMNTALLYVKKGKKVHYYMSCADLFADLEV